MERLRNFVQSRSPESLFLWLGIPLVLLFIVIIPAFQGWDEATHFSRAYQISTGQFRATKLGAHHYGGPIPINISNMEDTAVTDIIHSAKTNLAWKAHIGYYKTYLKQTHPDKNIVNKYFASSAIYSPVSYAPQSIGIYLARSFRFPVLLYDYVGRVFGAAAFLAMVYFAIRLAPRGKWALFAIAILPTSLAAAATLSPDALLNGAALLLLGAFLNALLSRKTASYKLLLTILGAILILSLAKQAYFLFALLPLLLPPRRVFGSIKRYILWNFIFIAMALIATFGWYSQISEISPYTYLESRPAIHINQHEQQSYILHHPITYLGTLLWQMFGHFNSKFIEAVGLYTWKGIVMPYLFIFWIYIGLLIAFIKTRYEQGIDYGLKARQYKLLKYGPIIIGFGTSVLIFTALYLSFNPVGSQNIEGVTGRYFIPLLPLLIPITILARKRNKPMLTLSQPLADSVLIAIFIAQNLIAIFVILATNYIPHWQFV